MGDNLIQFPLRQHICPSCDSANVIAERIIEMFPYGIGDERVTLSAAVPQYACRDCQFVFQDSEAEDLRHEAVCRHLGVLSPREIRAIRGSYGSRTEFARLTRIGEASIGRWESGSQIQSAAMDLLLRLLAKPGNASLVVSGSVWGKGSASPRPSRFPDLEITPELADEAKRFVL